MNWGMPTGIPQFFLLNHCQGVEIDDGGGDGQQGGVETVEHAAVSREDMA